MSRSLKKGPFCDDHLMKKVVALNEAEKKEVIKTWSRRSTIFPQFVEHTFAVLTLAAGSDLYTVGKLLGHTSINSTQVYADVVMETKVEAISRISNYFSNL